VADNLAVSLLFGRSHGDGVKQSSAVDAAYGAVAMLFADDCY